MLEADPSPHGPHRQGLLRCTMAGLSLCELRQQVPLSPVCATGKLHSREAVRGGHLGGDTQEVNTHQSSKGQWETGDMIWVSNQGPGPPQSLLWRVMRTAKYLIDVWSIASSQAWAIKAVHTHFTLVTSRKSQHALSLTSSGTLSTVKTLQCCYPALVQCLLEVWLRS